MFYIIVSSITIIAFILLIVVIYYNKFQFAIIKIEEAEANTDIYLNKKYDLLKRSANITKKELKQKQILEKIDNLKLDDLNHFELNIALSDIYADLYKIIDDNEKLLKSEALTTVLTELNNIEENLIGSIKFYNDTVVEFNHLITSFPSNIIRLLFGYKQKDFYSQEKHEMFEILKEK